MSLGLHWRRNKFQMCWDPHVQVQRNRQCTAACPPGTNWKGPLDLTLRILGQLGATQIRKFAASAPHTLAISIL